MIAVIDYGIGNLGSVLKAFEFLKTPVKLTNDSQELKKADGIVLPGVGAFGEGMTNLRDRGMDKVILDLVNQGKPFLGICLGFQLLFTTSEEDKETEGLKLIEGKVKRFQEDEVGKVPHMGWNQIELARKNKLFAEIETPCNFYFVHSYYADPTDSRVILGKTQYGPKEFVSVVNKENIWGIQCHPEKSSKTGLKFLKNFSEVVG